MTENRLGAAEALIREYTRLQPAPFIPEFHMHLGDLLVPLWRATEVRAGSPQPPPFWAFAWPGSQALARFVLDRPWTVDGKRVLDFGAGGGLAAIAAASRGAAHVLASDLDPLAAVAQRLNGAANAVSFVSVSADLVGRNRADLQVDVVLAGDVCYEREPSAHITRWLQDLAAEGASVLLADPGRAYGPAAAAELLATYDVPTLEELESVPSKLTRLWRLGGAP